MSKLKRLVVFTMTAIAAIALTIISASACTGIYVGSDLTEDGGTYFARSEDISNSYNKVFYVSQAGKYQAGDVYKGCYGFVYTFQRDSYSFTTFADDNLLGECPDCGGTHVHNPYGAAGTNSEGVSITATVTISGNSSVRSIDPMSDSGIEEAEIVTVVLSQASTAREGVELLLGIYDEYGTAGSSGIFIADATETWYIENYCGHQYLALRMPSDLIFVSPNMGAIGRIDLDAIPEEDIYYSEGIIDTAVEAGTFVGDADEMVIDYAASYTRSTTANARLVNGVNYLSAAYDYTSETLTPEQYMISNLDAEGNVVPLYTNIEADRVITTEDMVDFYKVDGIGSTSNLEYHVFQIKDTGNEATSTVMWVGMDHGQYGVSVPYYPMLTTDTYAGYQVGTDSATFTTTKPQDSFGYYPTTGRIMVDGNRVTVDGYKVLPEGWEDSYYWCYDMVSNFVVYGDCTDEEEAQVIAAYAQLQDEIYTAFNTLKNTIVASSNPGKTATQWSKSYAEKAHVLARDLYFEIALNNEIICVLGDETLPQPEGYTVTFLGENNEFARYSYGDSSFMAAIAWMDDVITTDWYAENVEFVVENGIFTGVGDNRFAPESNMTRAMFATVLYRIAGAPVVDTAEIAYTDVEEDTWYTVPVIWATENGIINGYGNGKFGPNDMVTREQMVAMLYRYEASTGADMTTTGTLEAFSDAANVSEYAAEAMTWAVEKGIITGFTDGTLKPQNTATRAQVAAMLSRYL